LQRTLDEISASVEEEQKQAAANFKNDPPKIIYATTPSILVTIDGEPKLQQDEKIKMKKVINTPFLIVQYPKNNQYFLYGGRFWYTSASISSAWTITQSSPNEIQR